MEKRSLHARLGLTVSGLDVRRITDAEIDELHGELECHGVLFFPDQLLEDADLLAFSLRWGELEEPARKIVHSPGSRQVGYLTNLRKESGEPLGYGGNHTDFWHSDQEYRLHPATLATLYCLVPSPVGGSTSFSSTAVESLNLPPELHRLLQDREVTYLAPEGHDNVERVEVAHPVLLMSPRRGRESIYVSENAKRFIGLAESEGDALKRELLARILAAPNIYTHHWSHGDLVIYDNTQLLHRRDAFQGLRWLKATKIFASADRLAVPTGRRVE